MQLKKIGLLLVFIMVMAVSFAHAEEAKGPATITVQGNGQLDMVPDVSYIELAVVSSAATVNEAQKENAAVANQVYNQLIAAGIDKSFIKTTQYNVVPLYEQGDNSKEQYVPVIRGYQIVNSFNVTVSPEKVGAIIDLALQSGVNQVQTVRFGKLDEAGSKNIVLQMAVREALSKAEAIAAALGKRISRVQNVNETGVYMQMPELNRYSKALDNAATPISAGYVHLNANVQLIVEME